MLDYLGVTENWSAIENIPWTQRWIFSDDATQEPISLDGVTFTGKIYIEQQDPVDLDIQKSTAEEEANILTVSCPGLPEGRHAYEIYSVSESGNQNRLISGYIGVIKSIGKLVDNTKTYVSRTLSIRLPGDVTRQIRLEWNSCTIASISAEHALNAAKQSHTDAETARQAATTATGAASTATERAKEAEGYAGSADASKVAAFNSEAVAATSAANAARDAKVASEAKTAMEGLASTFPQTVSNAEQAISAAKEDAITAVQAKQSDAVLAVGRASQTAQQSVASAQSAAVTAVGTAETEAVQAVKTAQATAESSIGGMVKEATDASTTAKTAQTAAESAAERAGTSATNAASSATAAQQALAAIPQVDAGGNMTLAGGLTTAAVINANGGINIPVAPADWRHAAPLVDMASVMMMCLGQVDSYIREVTSVEGQATAITPGVTYTLKSTVDGGSSVHKISIMDINDGWNSFPSGIMYQIGHGVNDTSCWKLTQIIGHPPAAEALTTDFDTDCFTLNTSSASHYGMVLSVKCLGQSMSTSSSNLTVEIVYYDDAAAKWIRQVIECLVPYGGYGGNSASIYVHGLLLVWPPRNDTSQLVTGALYAVLSRNDARLIKLADVPWRGNSGQPLSVVGSMYVNMYKYYNYQSLVIRAPRMLNLGINGHDTLCDVLGTVAPSAIKSIRVTDYIQPA